MRKWMQAGANEATEAAALPLSGIRVVEFCQVAAGPFSSMLLADMGADVVKVESPAGDGLRQWPPFEQGFSHNFASLNRNKRSVVLNLKEEADRDSARALILQSDVVIENNRPGVMDRLGLGYEQFAAEKPGLVYCSISAFGQSGPRRDQGGFDVTIQAVSGIMSVTGEPDGPPVKCGVPLSDFATGLYAAFSITALLHQVRETGRGGYIDISLMGSSLGVAALQTSEYFGSNIDPRKLGSAHPRNAPYQAFAARDGHLVVAAGNDKLWRSFCDAISRPDLAGEERFSSTSLRARHQEELRQIVEQAFQDRSVEDLIAGFSAVGVPCAPINTYSRALADPQVKHMGWVQEMDLPTGSRIPTFISPISIDGKVAGIWRGAPDLGEHTDEVLAELATAATDSDQAAK